jgi:hypothetical protein
VSKSKCVNGAALEPVPFDLLTVTRSAIPSPSMSAKARMAFVPLAGNQVVGS